MAQDFEQITFTGRLGNDPEMRFTPDGTPVTSFSVACNRRNGSTIWYRVSAWDKQAEPCNQYLEKGRAVLVNGILQPDKDTGSPRIWNSDNGPRASYEVRAFTVQFLGGGNGSGSQGNGRSDPTTADEFDDSDVPF